MSFTLERIGGVKAYDEKGRLRSFEIFRVNGSDYFIHLDGAVFSGKMKHREAIEQITAEISTRGWTRGGGRA